MKKNILWLVLVIFLASCSTEANIDNKKEIVDLNKYSQEDIYNINWNGETILNLYWVVESQNTKIFSSNISWNVESLNCQVWKEVSKWDIIAKISPDVTDTAYKNASIQISSVKSQIANIYSIKEATLNSFDNQKNQLILQQKTSTEQLDLLNKNLSNIWNLKNISISDIDIQKEWLDEQLTTLNNSKSILEQNKEKSLKSIENSIFNLKWQIKNTVDQSLEEVDKIFGITDNRETYNDAFEDYLCVKDSQKKNSVINTFTVLNKDNFSDLTDETLPEYLKSVADLLSLSSDCVKKSVVDVSLTQTAIDWYYSTLNNYSNSILSYKTSLDGLLDSYVTSGLSFDSQISTIESSLLTLENNLKKLTENSSDTSNISYDNQIISLNSQITNLKNTLSSIQEQIESLEESKNSQIKQFDNQLVSLNQSLSTLYVAISSQTIKSDLDWIIKEQKSSLNSKVNMWSAICSVIPKNENNLVLKIYSPKQLNIWTEIIYKKWENSWTWSIDFESPVKDMNSQSYIYESKIDFSNFKDQDKLDISVKTKISNIKNDESIWIPVEYVKAKLEWNYVNLLTWVEGDITVTKVELWNLNNNLINIKSGLKIWDRIVK